MENDKVELKKKWNSFLIECWLRNKGINMSLVVNQFDLINDTKILDENFNTVPKLYHLKNDVFGYMAANFPKISDYLLNTKKTDTVRIDKIISALNNTKPSQEKRKEDKSIKEEKETVGDGFKAFKAMVKTVDHMNTQKNQKHNWSIVK